MITLTGTITIPTAEQPAILPLLDVHVRLTLAEQGCIRFSVTRDAENPERFRVDEAFVDGAAFDAHQKRTRESEWGVETAHLARDFVKSGG